MARESTAVEVHAGDLSLSALRRIYERPVRVHLAGADRKRISAATALVDRIVAAGDAAYGINTGFGLLAQTRIPTGDLELLQQNLLLSHAAGVGEPLPDAVVHLLAASELRLECERAGVAQLDRKRTQVPMDPKKRHMQPQMREMLHLRFAQDSKADPAQLMQMVARQAKNGAQFTPQGVLKWPISAAGPAEIIAEAKALLESIETPARG